MGFRGQGSFLGMPSAIPLTQAIITSPTGGEARAGVTQVDNPAIQMKMSGGIPPFEEGREFGWLVMTDGGDGVYLSDFSEGDGLAAGDLGNLATGGITPLLPGFNMGYLQGDQGVYFVFNLVTPAITLEADDASFWDVTVDNTGAVTTTKVTG